MAAATVFFYDYFLTLADEVSMSSVFLFAMFMVSPMEDQLRLAREEIMG